MTGERGLGHICPCNPTSHPAWWAKEPSGWAGQGAAFTPSSRTRRPLKGYYPPSRWDIVPANDCVAPDVFQGPFQKQAKF